MQRETIENILNFLKEKEGKEVPDKWKLIKELETHPDGTQYRYDGMLDLRNTNISKLPNDLYIGGHLRLYGCEQITKLPDKLYVRDNLNLTYSNIKKLPNGLHVKGHLFLVGTSIEELPNNLYVGGNLFIRKTSLAKNYTDEEIKEIVASTGGQIEGQIYRE